MVSVLQDQLSKIRLENVALKEKHKSLTEKCAKYKRDYDLVKQTAYLSKTKGASGRVKLTVSEVDVVPAPNPRQQQPTVTAARAPNPPTVPDALGDTSLMEVARSYKAR